MCILIYLNVFQPYVCRKICIPMAGECQHMVTRLCPASFWPVEDFSEIAHDPCTAPYNIF